MSENGSIPHPDSLKSDGAGWSYFMPWYGEYTMDGWAHDNTAADWKAVMNNDYVITLDKMPGWDSYTPTLTKGDVFAGKEKLTIHTGQGYLVLNTAGFQIEAVELFSLRGTRLATLNQGVVNGETYRFSLAAVPNGVTLVSIKRAGVSGRISRLLYIQ